MKLGIILPTINCKDLLYESLQALNKQVASFEELLIVDNGQSAEKDPSINSQQQNMIRYVQKWGGAFQHETFLTPYNK